MDLTNINLNHGIPSMITLYHIYIYKVVPPSYKLVYNPINYRYITNKNHSYWSYVHQLSYRPGAPPCIYISQLYPP